MRTFKINKSGTPNLSAMMFATVNALRDGGGSGSIQEIDERVAELEGVSEEEQTHLMPNGKYRRFNYFLAWARTYLKKGGAVDNSKRGVWSLTQNGEAIKFESDTKKIFDQVVYEETEKRKQKRDKQEFESENDDVLPSEPTNHQGDWRVELLDSVKAMSPDGFERLAQRLLREAGFTKVEVRGKSGDGGIDGVGILRVNLVTFQVYFQCKKWAGSVPSKEIRDFRGALQGRADKGLFITTGNFTAQASDEATRDGAIAIDLIDGPRLCDLLKQFDLGVETKMIESVKIDAGWFLKI